MAIPFTQFKRPNGRTYELIIERTPLVQGKADYFIGNGGRFECEELTTGEVSFTANYGDTTIIHEICTNDEAVCTTVDKIIAVGYKWMQRKLQGQSGGVFGFKQN